jgi:hypothetical protein
MARWRPALLTLAAFVAAGIGWAGGGWAAAWLGVGELDLPARVCAVFALLTATEAILARVLPGASHE